MAEVGVAFLSAFVGVVFEKMASPGVVDFIYRRKSTEGLLKKMERSLRLMNMVLEDAEEKEVTSPYVKMWIDDLKDVAYTAEDILDEIAIAGKVRNFISSTSLDPFVHRIEPKIKDVLDALQELITHKDIMGLKGGVAGKQYPKRLPYFCAVESETFGRNEDKNKVIDLLLPFDAEANERCVIAIVGMGGIGKTTLAELVYNESRVKQHFDLKIWFRVSEEFVIPNVEKSIIEAATSLPCPKFKNLEKLQVTVQKNLNGKKFLLVLDDVWSENPIHKEFLVQLLAYGTRGSKILVTTRNDSVALAMHAERHHLNLLPWDYCQLLFEKHAFRNGSFNADPMIKEIGEQIVTKCKGLPLAIKAIGNLLWFESNVERWTNVSKSKLWESIFNDILMEESYILPALRLSYQYLPSYLKRCFAYCSIFPNGYIFTKDELVQLWMAEGFLQQSKIRTMEEVGNHYFDELVLRSLFQQSLGTNSSFVMHDCVRDLAKFVNGQFGFTRLMGDGSEEIGKMTRYLSYVSGSLDDFKKIKEDLYKAKQLRTFLAIGCNVWGEIKMPRPWCLKVLSLSGGRVTKLHDSIGKMKHLRYLDVSNSSLNRLPNSICNLCNLQTLKLSRCDQLDRLPRDMWKLINLRHLEIDRTRKLIKEMPIHMGRLKCLQTLSKFIVSKHSRSGIGELGKLINLQGKLLIQELQNVRSAEDAFDASLKDKAHLEQLVLQWSPPKKEGILESQRSVFENLQPHKNLKSLTINDYCGNSFPYWIGQRLPSLFELELIDCKYCSALPPLGHVPFLKRLKIVRLEEVVTVGPEFYGNSSNSSMKSFGSLKVMRLEYMSNWENWLHLDGENEVETFFQLEELYIKNCPKLRAKLPVHPFSLAKLQIINCKNLELPMRRQYSSLEELHLINSYDSLTSFPLDLFPNLKSIRIEGSNNLQSLEQHGGDLVISKLRIRKCPNFVDFPKGGLRTSNLANFIVKDCESLKSMPEKMHLFLPSLCYLELRNCPEVESFPEGGLPSNLKQIMIIKCKKLIANWKGWDLQILPSLEWLEIDSDRLEDHVESFPGRLLLPTTLTNLKIASFGNLKSLDKERFQHLTSLVQLRIYNCPKLKWMPEEGFPASLRFLDISDCHVLEKELKGIEREEWLKVARIPDIIIGHQQIQGDAVLPAFGKASPYEPPDEDEYE